MISSKTYPSREKAVALQASLFAEAVAPEHSERAGRAESTFIQRRTGDLKVSVDMLPYDPQRETAQCYVTTRG